jgi:hypothetical protein
LDAWQSVVAQNLFVAYDLLLATYWMQCAGPV